MAGRFDFGYRPNLSVSSPLHAANAMVQNNNSEVNESSPNVQKLAPINDVLNKCSNSSMLLRVKKLSKKAVLPSRAVALSCGYNLYSAMETKVPAQGKVLVPTDLSIAIPEGTYARIVSLSKLTLKHAISVGAGVIDADYRGPVGLILFNHSDVDFEVRVGDRIAQLILPKIPTPNVLEGKDLGSTVGIEGGFGSIAMVHNYNSEAHEPLSKVPKLAHMNDVLNKCSNSSMLLRVEKLSEKAVLPLRASALSAGYDLSSAMETKVPARGKVLVSTDLSIAIPEGTYARIAPRSGLALKHAIHVGEGVIDADYRGPVGVILFNHSDVDFEVKVGDRIAQLILETIATPNVLEGEDLDSTVRAMAQNYNSEANELLPKVPKLAHMNGVLNKCSNSSMLLRVEKLSEKAVLPLRPSALSAGYDLSSAMETKVPARGRVMVPIDLSIAIPEGTYARIASRSGLGLKHAIEVGAGMIDADYIGPIGVILFNHSDVDFEVKVGDRIAQLILEKIATLNVLEVEDLDSTVRGEGGFGSTGL